MIDIYSLVINPELAPAVTIRSLKKLSWKKKGKQKWGQWRKWPSNKKKDIQLIYA